MISLGSFEELKVYYKENINTYVFEDDVEFNFDVDVESHISAYNIYAYDIKSYDINALNINASDIKSSDINALKIISLDINASDINALNIYAGDINARNIMALNIVYFSVCFSHGNIICNSIKRILDNYEDGE
jgi:hypothetical protein